MTIQVVDPKASFLEILVWEKTFDGGHALTKIPPPIRAGYDALFNSVCGDLRSSLARLGTEKQDFDHDDQYGQRGK